MKFQVVPEGFGDMLRWADKEYNDPEIIITENGFSDRGTLEDNDRISYFNVFICFLESISNLISYFININYRNTWQSF